MSKNEKGGRRREREREGRRRGKEREREHGKDWVTEESLQKAAFIEPP